MSQTNPQFFRPHALAQMTPGREGYLIRDLTMPEKDWPAYDEPTHLRRAREAMCKRLAEQALFRVAYEEGIYL